MTPPLEAERIAKGLSEAQRERLKSWQVEPGKPDGAIGDLANDALIDVFVRKDDGGVVIAWNWIPTPLGLAVRDILLKEPKL